MLVHQFRHDPQKRSAFFRPLQRGPRSAPARDPVRELTVALRKRKLSVYDIQRELAQAGQRISINALSVLMRQEGFARLPRRRDQERPSTVKAQAAAVADVRCLDLSPGSFRTTVAGLLRQLTVLDLGHEEPTVLLTNNLKLSPATLVTRYAQRMLIENKISESIQFFHLDALSSMLGLKVDFDLQLTLMAGSLYRLMARRIGREYDRAQPKKIFRNLLDLSARVEVETDRVVVTIDKRAHNPCLVASGLVDKPVPMPWFGNKQLLIHFA